MQRLTESRISPRQDAIISLALGLAVVLVIGTAILLMQSRSTLLFYISGICSGYGIRISVARLRGR